jgi:ABC-type branched-subunit amino acid transport system permease subunit
MWALCVLEAFFTGVGGYFAAIFNVEVGLPIWLSMPLATIAGAVFCTVVLLPCLPLRVVYFAIVTLMYPLLFTRIIEALNILGGTNGMTGVAPFPNAYVENYVIIVLALAFLFAMRRFVNEDAGLVLRAVKDNDQSVRASGISVTRMRIIGVFIASLLGCLAGAYIAHLYMWAGISLFALDFFDHSHCRSRYRGRRDPGGRVDRCFHPCSPVGDPQGLRDFQDRYLLHHPDGVHRVQERGYHDLPSEKVSPV